jgi:hypothetical protein
MDGFRRDATTWSRTPPVGAAGADNGTRPEAIEPADSDTGILQIPGPRGVARDLKALKGVSLGDSGEQSHDENVVSQRAEAEQEP